MTQMPPAHGADNTHGRLEIRVKGQLDARWSTWFDGLTVTVEDGNTLIHGQIVDQAALFGVLQKLRDLALPLISVELDSQGSTKPPPGC
jgi:hypothetical protein